MKTKIMLLAALSMGLMTIEGAQACPGALSYADYEALNRDSHRIFEVYWWAPGFVAHPTDSYVLSHAHPVSPSSCYYARNTGGGAVFAIMPRP